MSREFNGILPVIVSGLAQKIASEQSADESAILNKLYTSKLYALLEREDTGIWRYSVPLLYEIYQEELATGEVTFPS